jgi:hypothetical protein
LVLLLAAPLRAEQRQPAPVAPALGQQLGPDLVGELALKGSVYAPSRVAAGVSSTVGGWF